MHQSFFCSPPCKKDTEESEPAPRILAAVEMTRGDLGDYCYTRQKKMLYVCQELSVINELLCWLSIGSWAGHRGWWMHNKQTLHCQQADQPVPPHHTQQPYTPHHDGISSLGSCHSSISLILGLIQSGAASLNGDSLVNMEWITVV